MLINYSTITYNGKEYQTSLYPQSYTFMLDYFMKEDIEFILSRDLAWQHDEFYNLVQKYYYTEYNQYSAGWQAHVQYLRDNPQGSF